MRSLGSLALQIFGVVRQDTHSLEQIFGKSPVRGHFDLKIPLSFEFEQQSGIDKKLFNI